MARGKKKAATDEALRAEIQPYQAEAMGLLGALSVFKIETQAHADMVAQIAMGCAAKRKDLEERLAKIIDPLKASQDAAKAEFKPAIDSYKQGEMIAKGLIDKHQAEQRAAQAQALQVAASAPDLTQTALAVFDNHVQAPLPQREVSVFTISDEVALKCAIAHAYLYMHKDHPQAARSGDIRPALVEAFQVHEPTVKRLHKALPVPGCVETEETRSTL